MGRSNIIFCFLLLIELIINELFKFHIWWILSIIFSLILINLGTYYKMAKLLEIPSQKLLKAINLLGSASNRL